MAKNGTSYTRKGGIYHPLTNTQQVMNPDGTRLEQRLQYEEQAVRGKGGKASAHEYPMRYLGNYGSITALNAALNEIFHTTDPHWQGCLRAHMAGQVIFVSQMALNFSIGDWAQVVTGMVAPSQDGTVLVRSNTPGIYWRSRETQGETVVSRQWQSLSSLVLKTVNGQSLIGGGDITISAGGTVPIDDELDETSQNAIANAAVAKAVGELWDAIDALPDAAEGGVLVCKKWGNDYVAFSEGDYAYDPLQAAMYKYTSGAWEYQGYPKEGVIYINAPAQSSHYWDGTTMIPLLGEAPLSAVNVNSSAPVNSKAVADYVEKERKVVKLTYWGNLTQNANIGEYGYDTNDNQIYLFTDSVDPQGSWVSIGTPKEDLLYLREELSTYYHYDGDEMIAMLDADKMVSSIPETGGTSVFPTVAGVKNYVDGKDAAMKTYVDNAVANVDPSGESPTVKGFGTDNYGNPLFPEYYLPVTFEGETALLGELYNSDDPDARTAAEEYIANIKWGIPFYEWPLRCYNGAVSGITPLETGAEDIEVFAPSERIIDKHGVYNDDDHTTDDVYFYSTGGYFVLRHNNAYYSVWKNSIEWNTKLGTLKARPDCVFSDIHIEDDPDLIGTEKTVNNEYQDFRPSASGQSRRVSYIYKDNALTEISTQMTDFTKAVSDCIASSTGKNAGDMRLSDRIYFLGNYAKTDSGDKVCIHFESGVRGAKGHANMVVHSDYTTTIGNKSNFTIDGGKGVLFFRAYYTYVPRMKGWPWQPVFKLNNASNCKLRNLTMRVLRDKDNGGVNTIGYNSNSNLPLSSSDSCLSAFEFGSDSHDILLENIDICGFNHDFLAMNAMPGSIVVKNLRSRGMLQNAISGPSWTMENWDVEQRDWAGSGAHIFYPQVNSSSYHNMKMKNSRLRQGEYTSVAFGMHELEDNTVKCNIEFEDCVFEGSRFFEGSGTAQKASATFKRCQFKQIFNKYVYTDLTDAAYFISVRSSSWVLDECLVKVMSGNVFGNFAGVENERIILRNSEFYTLSPSDGGVIISAGNTVGKLTIENVRTNFTQGIIGSARYNVSSELKGELALQSVQELDKEINGTEESSFDAEHTVETEGELPAEGIEVNEAFLITSTMKVAYCTQVGVRTMVHFLVGRILEPPQEEIERSFTFRLNSEEEITITISYNSSTTMNDIATAVRSQLASRGYDGLFVASTETDWYCYSITAKNVGKGSSEAKTFYSRAQNGIQTIMTNYSVHGTGANHKYGKRGQDTLWEYEDFDPSGLAGRVDSLSSSVSGCRSRLDLNESAIFKISSKVIPDAPIAGRSADRPDPAEVGPGYCYFDLQLGTSGKAIFSTGSGWVLADGSDPDS